MPLQYITDTSGTNTAVLIPINEWELIILKHEDLKKLENLEVKPKTKLSDLAGKLSNETAEAMLQYVAEGRNNWDKRLFNQL
jgi:hypothetical protein